MGFFSNMIKDQVRDSVIQSLREAEKKKAAGLEIQGKAKLAQKMRSQAKEQADQYLRILHDCTNLVNTTTNPQVFFERWELMVLHLGYLVGLECTGIFENSRELPSEALKRVETQFPAATNDFIDRAFAAAKERADKLKTEKGKQSAILRFFEGMERYAERMDSESIVYFYELKDKHTI